MKGTHAGVAQTEAINRKVDALESYVPSGYDKFDTTQIPAEAEPLNLTNSPFVAIPAPGASAVMFQFVVPTGQRYINQFMAIIIEGGGFIDGTGDVTWAVTRNGAGLRGLQNLTAQLGSFTQPAQIYLGELVENDILQVVATTKAGILPLNVSCGVLIRGYLASLVKEGY